MGLQERSTPLSRSQALLRRSSEPQTNKKKAQNNRTSRIRYRNGHGASCRVFHKRNKAVVDEYYSPKVMQMQD